LQAYNLTAGQINIVNADEKKSAGMLYPAAQLVIHKGGDSVEAQQQTSFGAL
jgi:hypothetical protein